MVLSSEVVLTYVRTAFDAVMGQCSPHLKALKNRVLGFPST